MEYFAECTLTAKTKGIFSLLEHFVDCKRSQRSGRLGCQNLLSTDIDFSFDEFSLEDMPAVCVLSW